MPDNLKTRWQPANPESLAQQFSRLGWIGFWIQFALLAIPIVLLVYVLFFSGIVWVARSGPGTLPVANALPPTRSSPAPPS